jgi:hypothetical protein
LDNGSRVRGLPGSDESVRGLTVDGWIVADEAARVSDDLIAALRPMRARRPEARFAMLSTAYSRTDPFWTAWVSDDRTWMRLQATAASDPTLFKKAFLEQERRALGEHAFNREYLGIPGGESASPFSWELYEQATQVYVPLVRPGSAFLPNREDIKTWPYFRPLIIAHDVGRSRDRSTAVIGGNCPYGPTLLGIGEIQELPQGLCGSARASALAAIDRLYQSNALIVVDLSYDPTYAEPLFETFGERIIGLQISRHGDGMTFERRPVKNRSIPVYTVGRTYLLDLYYRELQAKQVRMIDEPMSRRAYEELNGLEMEMRDTGTVYHCLPGQHDDLGMSCAMLAWAAQHPHLQEWVRLIEDARRPRRPRRDQFGWGAFV